MEITMYSIVTHRRNRRRTRISNDYNLQVNQLAKTLEMHYMSRLDSAELPELLGKSQINRQMQCIYDVYVDEDAHKVVCDSIKLVKWRKANNKVVNKPKLPLVDFN